MSRLRKVVFALLIRVARWILRWEPIAAVTASEYEPPHSAEGRQARAQRFVAWVESDGLGAAIAGIRATYIDRISKLDPAAADFASKARILAVAAKVVDQVDSHIRATIADGQVASADITRMERRAELSAEKRRYL